MGLLQVCASFHLEILVQFNLWIQLKKASFSSYPLGPMMLVLFGKRAFRYDTYNHSVGFILDLLSIPKLHRIHPRVLSSKLIFSPGLEIMYVTAFLFLKMIIWMLFDKFCLAILSHKTLEFLEIHEYITTIIIYLFVFYHNCF